jgi:CheY-like chemotaxis protein
LLWSASANHREACASLFAQLGLHVDLLPLDPLAAQVDIEIGADTLLIVDVPAAGAMPFDLDQLQGRLGLAETQVVALLPAGQTEAVDACKCGGLMPCITKPPRASELAAILASESKGGGTGALSLAPEGRTLRLLVADDSPVNQEVAAGLLELCGHQVVTVNTGSEAVAAWQREHFDAIFMDLEMPEMDGLEATQCIRRKEADTGRRTPIIALTAHALRGVHERCLAAGMDRCITKPLQPDELMPLVASLAESSAGATVA